MEGGRGQQRFLGIFRRQSLRLNLLAEAVKTEPESGSKLAEGRHLGVMEMTTRETQTGETRVAKLIFSYFEQNMHEIVKEQNLITI